MDKKGYQRIGNEEISRYFFISTSVTRHWESKFRGNFSIVKLHKFQRALAKRIRD